MHIYWYQYTGTVKILFYSRLVKIHWMQDWFNLLFFSPILAFDIKLLTGIQSQESEKKTLIVLPFRNNKVNNHSNHQ